MPGINPTRDYREGPTLPPELSMDGSYTGDDVDWDLAPGIGGQDQWKQPVRCATTASITIATALNAGDTLDGVTLTAGDRVLVKDQGTASQNGIYIVDATPYRAPDLDEDAEVLGAVVFVIAGTANAGTAWKCTNTTAVTVDTTSMTWAAFGGGISGTYELNTEGGQSVIHAHGAMGAAETFDPTDGNVHTGTLDADCTITLAAPTGTGACTLEGWVTEDGTGGWTVSFAGWAVTEQGTHDTAAGTTSRFIAESVDGGTTGVVTWIGGGGSTVAALDDLTDVTITSPASGDRLRYDGSGWVNANLHDEPMIATDGTVMVDGLLNPMMHEVSW